jgi:hypothetical protein
VENLQLDLLLYWLAHLDRLQLRLRVVVYIHTQALLAVDRAAASEIFDFWMLLVVNVTLWVTALLPSLE